MAGIAGSGGSSYIDSVILRDRDANTNWEDSADATLEERTYYCQNWRADVIALMTSGGVLINQVRYDPYGKPFGISKTDLDADGDVDAADYTVYSGYYSASTMPWADWNWDGTKNTTDTIAYLSDRAGDVGLGRGDLSYAYSRTGGANRKGYAGYEIDPVLTGSEGWESVYHIRHRVLLSQLGRWTRRDPIGYVDGPSLYHVVASAPLLYVDPAGLGLEGCYTVDDPAPHCDQLTTDFAQCNSDADAFFDQCKYGCTHQGCIRACQKTADDMRKDCYADAINRAYGGTDDCPPLDDDSICCDDYAPDDTYMFTNARCFCKCAGNSAWSRAVRGCLRCLYSC